MLQDITKNIKINYANSICIPILQKDFWALLFGHQSNVISLKIEAQPWGEYLLDNLVLCLFYAAGSILFNRLNKANIRRQTNKRLPKCCL